VAGDASVKINAKRIRRTPLVSAEAVMETGRNPWNALNRAYRRTDPFDYADTTNDVRVPARRHRVWHCPHRLFAIAMLHRLPNNARRLVDKAGLAVSRRTSFAHCCQPLESGTAIEPISVADRTGKSAEI
jgi:hypothetical protein